MSQPLTIDDAFALLANSNHFATARAEDKTLRTYIGLWRKGILSRHKKHAMLLKYMFKEVAMPMFVPPFQNNPQTPYNDATGSHPPHTTGGKQS